MGTKEVMTHYQVGQCQNIMILITSEQYQDIHTRTELSLHNRFLFLTNNIKYLNLDEDDGVSDQKYSSTGSSFPKWRDIDACLCFNDVFIFPIWDPEGVWLTIITRSLVKHTESDTECQSSLWQFRPGPGPMSPHDHRSPTSHLSYNVNAKYATKIIQTSAIVLIRYMDMVIDDVVRMRHYL